MHSGQLGFISGESWTARILSVAKARQPGFYQWQKLVNSEHKKPSAHLPSYFLRMVFLVLMYSGHFLE
jgi:hypothetical protein